jgi:prolyl-tRNA editing enzyme YbaK/EbsC (Cys-tRNA(Pro) deacylase)
VGQTCGDTTVKIVPMSEIKNIVGIEVGDIGPFVMDSGCTKIADESIFEKTTINFGTGEESTGIEMKGMDFGKIWDGIKEILLTNSY